MAANGANNIRIQTVNVTWEIEAAECIDLATGTDFDGTEFNLYEVDGTKVRVVFDEDASSTIPTAGAGERVLEVDVLSTDTLAQKATKLQTALDGDADFSASVSNTVVSVERVVVGEVTAPADVDSGLTVSVVRKGKNVDLGLLAEDVELNVTASNRDVTSHQNGTTPISVLGQGAPTVELTTTLLETNTASVKEIYKIYGGVFTPSGGTEVFGLGTSVTGKNLLTETARLKLSSANSGSDNNLVDITLNLALPMPETLTFSSEDPRTLTVSWKGYADLDSIGEANQLLFGDATQSGLDA